MLIDRLLKLAISILYFGAQSILSPLKKLTGGAMEGRLVALMYHSVKPEERQAFARQMDMILQAGTPVSADFDCKKSDAKRFISVTFDDGYYSLVDNAFPTMRQFKIPATVFVVTNCIGGPPSWIRQHHHRDASEQLLAIEQLRALRTMGVLIGSHSVSHRPLGEIGRTEAAFELRESRRCLEECIGDQVRLFAFPYGSHNLETVNLTKAAGYSRVFLSEPFRWQTDGDFQVVGRIGVSPGDWPIEFWLKIRDGYAWLPLAIRAKAWLRSMLGKSQMRHHEGEVL